MCGFRLRGEARGRRTLDKMGHWAGRYIHEVTHAVAHIQAKALGLEAFNHEEGKGQEVEE